MPATISATTDQIPTLPVNQLLLEALDQRWKDYRTELKRCRAEFSNEAVHDLRSAVRRMLAFIQLSKSRSARPRLERLNRALTDQLQAFNDLRDTQVVLAEISEKLQELPQLQQFENYLQATEPVRCYYQSCHAKAISTYLECMDQLDDFWRRAPDEPFPWEG